MAEESDASMREAGFEVAPGQVEIPDVGHNSQNRVCCHRNSVRINLSLSLCLPLFSICILLFFQLFPFQSVALFSDL